MPKLPVTIKRMPSAKNDIRITPINLFWKMPLKAAFCVFTAVGVVDGVGIIFVKVGFGVTVFVLVGCNVKVTGKENFIKGENYVVVYNHNALLDVPLSAPYIPGPNKTIAKDSFAKVPLFGWFYTRGSVLVDRNSDKSRIKSLDEMKKTLAAGMHMCLYPEGTRNKTKEPMKNFYDGAFKLALKSNKNIIPGVISGTKIAMPRHKTFYLYPTRLHLNFLPQVSIENETPESLKNKVFEIMTDKYVAEMKRFKGQ